MYAFFSPHSCVSGTDNIKHQNTVDLFGEIDPKVCASPAHIAALLPCVHFKGFIKHSLFHAGIQTQTHWQVSVVLFKKSRGWEIMAETYQRQDKGNKNIESSINNEWISSLKHIWSEHIRCLRLPYLHYNLSFLRTTGWALTLLIGETGKTTQKKTCQVLTNSQR